MVRYPPGSGSLGALEVLHSLACRDAICKKLNCVAGKEIDQGKGAKTAEERGEASMQDIWFFSTSETLCSAITR